ncbi:MULTISPECIES: acyl-CoA dehydrogenase [unclassified Nocardioides]|uniref:acyl-CoA dehydrogenase n=1 Tax=unclassified Nocardioides TaxID=2615069 RepID=UPI000056FE0F|nr:MULTISPECIES: acyl-CoA dehydrogenase [unclassified Nocardioides]ABL81364.1 acyl-CoA dehydrogenase domain protein [Nocardioides sp. JS614]
MSVLQDKLLPTLDYLLHEWLDLGELLERPRFADHDRGGIDDLLRAAADIAAEKYEPANRIIDDHEPVFDDGRVVLPKETAEAWNAFVEFGFLQATHDVEHGGMQLPRTADFAAKVIFGAASIGISPAVLTEANAALLLTYGNRLQRELFAARELTGRWTGTMCLSESQAGSSLSDITTRAVPEPDGADDPLGPRYRLTGNKMWISAGEHDLAENIVHLVLAKTPGPDGAIDPSTKGISLFVVPKFLVDTAGALLERNDVVLVGLNHKLGYRGTPNTALAFGDGTWEPQGGKGAVGYLVGEPGQGLRQMFHMMNAARIEIGLGAAALGFAGYAASLDYAKSRRQGRPLTRSGKDATQPQVPLVEHADVKRMLLAQKAYAEGGIALGLYAARLLDEQATGTPEQVAEAGRLLEILTPVVKSWPSEWCLEANSLAIQVLGGSGYTRDFPVEQYWRDNRLNMIHEGTHGIQALDLLGRKIRLEGGAYLAAQGERVAATVTKAHTAGFEAESVALAHAWRRVVDVAAEAWSTGDPEDALANATPYLQGFGHVVLAWVWLDVAAAAASCSHPEAAGKVAAMRYFYGYELPKVGAWFDVAARRDPLCRDLDPALL